MTSPEDDAIPQSSQDDAYLSPNENDVIDDSIVFSDDEDEGEPDAQALAIPISSKQEGKSPIKTRQSIRRYLPALGRRNDVNPLSFDIESSSSSSSEDFSSDDSWSTSVEEEENTVDWKNMDFFPTVFLKNPNYLDRQLVEAFPNKDGNRFVAEHRLLLQAILQLTIERDQIGVEGSLDSTTNIWKKGPLKKLSSGSWKIKYVELRRGNLVYYDDSGGGRKVTHLRTRDTELKITKDNCFEIVNEGSPTRTWMTRSEEELQAWTKAIQAAMIGSEDHRKIDISLYQDAIDIYNLIRHSVTPLDLHEDYAPAIRKVLADEWTSIQVPIQWVKQQISSERTEHHRNSLKRDPHKYVKAEINRFWKQMSLLSFSINGFVIPKYSPSSSERIFGGLTRCILEYDREFAKEDDEVFVMTMTELQAVSYARDILISIVKSHENADTYIVMKHLLGNDNLVTIERQENADDDIVRLEISFAGEEMPVDEQFYASTSEHIFASDIVCWLRTRRKNTMTWRKRFAVLSGVVISHFHAAKPRPHGLRGQLVLDASSSVRIEASTDSEHILCVSTSSEDRLLSFEDEATMLRWKDAIHTAIETTSRASSPRRSTNRKFLRGVVNARSSGIRAIKGATGGGIKVMKSAKDGGMKVFRSAVGMLRRREDGIARNPSLQVLIEDASSAPEVKEEPTVQVLVQAIHTYNVLEQGEGPSLLLQCRAKLGQAFLLSGGPSGKLTKGDVLVELEFAQNEEIIHDDVS